MTMANENGKFYHFMERMKFREFKALWLIFIVTGIFLIGAVMDQIKSSAKIDPMKDVYLFLHGRKDLKEEAEGVLITLGFSKENIIAASSKNVGNVGDYMAMLWRPPRPDQIKIQQITEVKEVEPDKMFGYWKGVLKKDIDYFLLK
ncbi:hydrolase of the alpha/beta superfamily [Candidatus Scalindua japonica]|uniref:Hydrolase of the alpha/beta superfamily n=2 Tax=Candidatus Scalindua japonica TaxID=1284222 RepID=A0A286TUK7_9BACT|nr:hydrolase of the alpha/beta superfamily [Candidatus Scalindua japonica]